MKIIFALPILLGIFIAGFLVVKSPLASSNLSVSKDAPYEVTVRVKEYKVEMSTTELPLNVPIKFNVVNEGSIIHEVVLEKAGAVDEPLEVQEEGGTLEETEVENVAPATTKSAVWTLTEGGAYQLACHIEGHFEGGMTTTFTGAPMDPGSLFSRSILWLAGGVMAALLGIVTSIALFRRSSRLSAAVS